MSLVVLAHFWMEELDTVETVPLLQLSPPYPVCLAQFCMI